MNYGYHVMLEQNVSLNLPPPQARRSRIPKGLGADLFIGSTLSTVDYRRRENQRPNVDYRRRNRRRTGVVPSLFKGYRDQRLGAT